MLNLPQVASAGLGVSGYERTTGLDVGATNVNLTNANNTITPTNSPYAGYLLKTISRINLDRITFPKIYKPANTKCQVDVCGSSLFSPQQTVTTVGVAISGGDRSATTYKKENAFDGNTATDWGSLQSNADQLGVSYIGRDFGSAYQVKNFTYRQSTGILMTSLKSQYSFDGSTWFDISTHTIGATATDYSFSLPEYPQARYFRLLANANLTSSNYWYVSEITIMAIKDNTFQSVGASSVTMLPSFSSSDDFYVGDTVVVTLGTGVGQTRRITTYNGTTKVATLDQPWTTLPTTSSGFALYDGIASDISPGFDFSTIDYTVYPTVNVLCALEKQAGATASPSMGVPIVTSIEKDWVSQIPIGAGNNVAWTTLLSATGRTRLDYIGNYGGNPAGDLSVRITMDGVALPILTFPNSVYRSMHVPIKLVSDKAMLVEFVTASGGGQTYIGYSK